LVVTAAWLVLLMGCANLCSLFLARSRSREPVAAVARALGATPFRLLRASCIESALVCAVGALASYGILVAVEETIRLMLPPVFGR
jgi:hypothetical protein